MSFGIDISYAQSLSLGIEEAVRGGVEFVILKAGGSNGGSRYTDSKYRSFAPRVRASGAVLGHYWFNGNGDPREDADYFVDNLSEYKKGDILVLDIENEVGRNGQTLTFQWTPQQALAFCVQVFERLGVVPMLYMSSSVTRSEGWRPLKDLGCKLWVAQYGANDGSQGNKPTNLGPWGNDWTIWQYSSAGKIAGYNPGVDVNTTSVPVTEIFKGDDSMSAEDVANLTTHINKVAEGLQSRIINAIQRENRPRQYRRTKTGEIAAIDTSEGFYHAFASMAERENWIRLQLVAPENALETDEARWKILMDEVQENLHKNVDASSAPIVKG